MKLYETADWDKVDFGTPCLVWNEGADPVIRDFGGMLNGKPVFSEGAWEFRLPVMLALQEMAKNVASERDVSRRALASLLKWHDISLALAQALTSFGGKGAQEVREHEGVARALKACEELKAQREAVKG